MAIEIEPGKTAGARRRRLQLPALRRPSRTSTSTPSLRRSTKTPSSTCSCWSRRVEGIGDRAHQLSGAFRRLAAVRPLHRQAQRRSSPNGRQALAGAIHHFSQLTTELGRHDREIERFVTSSKAALGNFANQQEAIQQALVEFPQALTVAEVGARQLQRALARRPPGAARPDPAGGGARPRVSRPASGSSNRRRGRSRTRSARSPAKCGRSSSTPRQGAEPLDKIGHGFGNALGGLNSFFNLLAFKPKGKESFLFYAPWSLHNLNASYLQDANGPVQRALAMITCNGTNLAKGITAHIALHEDDPRSGPDPAGEGNAGHRA